MVVLPVGNTKKETSCKRDYGICIPPIFGNIRVAAMSSVRSTGLRTRACAFNLQVPYPRSNSGKRTFAYSAATLFNCLDTDLKQIACVSPSSIIYSSRLDNFKHKLFILFLKFASTVSHLEELMCYDCHFSLYCNCIRR